MGELCLLHCDWYVQEHSSVRDAHGLNPQHSVQEVIVDVSYTSPQCQSTELCQAVRRAAETQQITRSLSLRSITIVQTVSSFSFKRTCLNQVRFAQYLFVGNFIPFPTVKEFENWLIFGKVIAKIHHDTF